jgi:copper chaperone
MLLKIKREGMKTYQFKTNIICFNCIAKVMSSLNANNKIKHWSVDMQNPQKILTVETENLTSDMVEEIVRNAGWKAEKIEL